MLADIQTFHLFIGTYPQTDSLLDHGKEDETDTERPGKSRPNTEELHADNLGGNAADIEQTGSQGSPGTTDTMDGDGTDRIVYMNAVNKQHGQDNNDSGEGANDD